MSLKGLASRRGKAPTWLITALLAAGAMAYVLFVFLPGQRSIGQLRSQLTERRQHILQANGLIGPIEQAAQRLNETQRVSSQWQDAAPNNQEIAGHMARLTGEAKASGVAIERFDPQPPVELLTLSQHGVNVQLAGEFKGIFEFLRRVEQLPGSVWVRDVRLTAEPAGLTVRGELTLTIFVDRSDSAD